MAEEVEPGGTDRPAAPDQEARDRIVADLDRTLFVEAGAGSGKTSALIDRVLALVADHRHPAELQSIAAITFTEKAAAELRERLRRELERGQRQSDDDTTRVRFGAALDQLDGAAIGTLHGFAQRLLSEHPVEAGLPPRVEVLDEVSSNVAFERRWSAFQDELLEDPDLQRTILLLLASGAKVEALRVLARAFDDNWDLVEERVPATASEPPPVAVEVRAALARVTAWRVPCRDDTDPLGQRLLEIEAWLGALAQAPDELEVVRMLSDTDDRPNLRVGRLGRKASFDDVGAVRAAVAALEAAVETARSRVAEACARHLGTAIRAYTLAAAAERRASGTLEFHDLLVLARALVRGTEHGASVRARLHERYRHLLLDEFQDTDPIQVELAVRIAAAHAGDPAAGTAPWAEVDVAPGHLFVVGDPKQSIYRFRRADIATFLAAEARFGPEGGGVVSLTANFRAVAPIIDWVNDTFSTLMDEPDDIELPTPSQPPYVALQATRGAPPSGLSVSAVGLEEHPMETRADTMRAAEAHDVVTAVGRALEERWPVHDEGDTWRAAQLKDITVLVPARTSLPFLEDAFDRAGIAFRAESSSLVYASRAVRDLLMVLRAAHDPTDHLSTVSALRTALLGCGDDDLFRFRVERRGRWSFLADQPESVPADDPVRSGLEYLRSLHDERAWMAPSELLGRIAVDRRAMELGFAQGRPRDVWRRLRFVVDQARAWTEATGGNLRQYLGWVSRQTAEGARVAESILPESDDDAVRIMTIHSAKGLEFPITIVSGMSTRPMSKRAAADVVFPPTGDVGYRFGAKVVTEQYSEFVPIDEQMGLHERVRLLYVACTRARDHLVVSLHRKGRSRAPKASARTNAELLLAGMGDPHRLPDAALAVNRRLPLVAVPPDPPPAFEAWEAERAGALGRASRPTTVAATALTGEGVPEREDGPDSGLRKRPRDLDLPPWLKGRYGTAVGRAVHGVLQTVDLSTGDGLAAAVAAQCEAEAVPDRSEVVMGLARAALGSPSVLEAAAGDHWREIYACAPLGDRLLEGYIDLLYRRPDGLVVVDYKTSATSDPEELERRVAGYRIQGASYALTMGITTGEPVTRVTFLFLTPQGAIERHLPDLGGGTDEVRRLVAAGAEVVTA